MLTAQTLKPFGFYLAEARVGAKGAGLPYRTGFERSAIATDEAVARVDAIFHFRRDKQRAESLANR